MRTSATTPALGRARTLSAGTIPVVCCRTLGARRATRAPAAAGTSPLPSGGRNSASARRFAPHATKGPVSDVEAVQRSLGAHKPVQPVSSEEREQVHLVAYLASLATNVEGVTAAQLVEHRLELVTTSARCGLAGGAAFDPDFDRSNGADSAVADWCDGDGMAAPASVVRANAERAASAIGGSAAAGAGDVQMGAGWGAPVGSSERRRGAHTLDALNAENDHWRLQGSGAGPAAAPSPSQLLGRRTSGAAAHPNALWEGMETDDEGAQEGPSIELLRVAAAAAAKEGRRGGAAAAPRLPATTIKGGRGGRQAQQVLRDPASRWLAADCPDTATRFFVISAPAALEAAFGATAAAQRAAANADTVTFESPSLHARVDRGVYGEASALYNALIPLIMDHLEANLSGRVALAGAGLGGSLAAVVTLMLAARGLRHGALAPAVALNSPPVVLETPDYSAFCSPRGCSLEEVAAMVNDTVSRGILSELGLPQGAVLNVFYAPTATGGAATLGRFDLSGGRSRSGAAGGGAAAAAAAAEVSLAPGGGGAVGGFVAGGALARLDAVLARRLAETPLLPEPLKGWLRGHEAAATAAAAEAAAAGSGSSGVLGLGGRPVQILNPVGRVLWYEPPSHWGPAGIRTA